MNSVFIKPTGENILIEPVKEKEGLLYIPAKRANDEKTEVGIVLACGPGRNVNGIIHGPEVEVGDKVVYPNYHARTLVNNGNKYVLMPESKLLMVLE